MSLLLESSVIVLHAFAAMAAPRPAPAMHAVVLGG